jgi:hypothetical protein
VKLKETRAENELFEHRFWLQIMGDHGRFIMNSLSLREKGDIESHFITTCCGYRTQPDTQVPLLPI